MGGKAVSCRPIKQYEASQIISEVRSKILSPLKIEKINEEYLQIGSAGIKPNPEDLSGDIDIGISISSLVKNNSNSNYHQLISKKLDELKINYVYNSGLNLFSLQWPIINEYAQVDLIPIFDMEWSKFIYYQPLRESKYKSAHRNWLFAAILSSIKENTQLDESGNLLEYEGYLMRLNEGFFKIKKSFKGKNLTLKKGKLLKEFESFLSTNPQDFINFLFGENFSPSDFTSFEKTWKIVESYSFKWRSSFFEIKENYIHFLNRIGLEIPKEI